MSLKHRFSIVLHEPEIPGNTGSIGRTCVALGIELILIKPYGFDITEKAVRRAGLDYWKHLDLCEFENWDDFFKSRNPESLMFFENYGEKSFFEANYPKDVYLVLGSETRGLPESILQNFPGQVFNLPMYSDKIRSLNLSNTATAIAYQCLGHQLGNISLR